MEGQVIIVTGSSRGIGRAIAEELARRGASVIINYRTSEEEAEAVERAITDRGGDAYAIGGDVTDVDAMRALVEAVVLEYGRIDSIVHNAFASYRFDPAERVRAEHVDWASYAAQLDGSLRAVVQLNALVLPYVKASHNGSIVHVLTNLIDAPLVSYNDYTTAKGAVETYSRGLARDVGRSGVRVNNVAPGLVYPTATSRSTKKEVRDQLTAQTPLGRLAVPEDVAGPVAFLVSEDARFMTSQTIYVDGGFTMNRS